MIDNSVNPQYYLDAALTDGPYAPFSEVVVNFGSNQIYVYDGTAANCDDVESFELIAAVAPEIITPTSPLEQCGSIILPFPMINNQDNLDFSYNTAADGTGTEFFDGDEITASDGISLLYLIAINNEGTPQECIDTTELRLSFLGGTSYTAAIPEHTCDTLFLPPILPASATVAYYDKVPGGMSYQPGDTITFAQAQAGNNPLDTLYLYDPTQTGACASIDTLVFEIGETPILAVPLQAQFCDQGLLPPPSNNNPNLEYASDREFTNILNPIFPINQSTQVFYRDSFAFAQGGACYALDSFFLEIISEPKAGQDSSIVICELTNQFLNIFEILGNPDTDGTFMTDSGLSLTDPTDVNIVNIQEGNYTIDYEISKPGCPTKTSQVTIEVVPPLNVGELTIDTVCASVGILDIPFLMGNPLEGGEWFFADSNMNPITVADPANWDVTTLPDGQYRITYTIVGTDDNPYCANRSSVNSLTIISDPSTGIDSTLRICQGYTDQVNLYQLLGTPDLGGSFAIDGNPVDFEITDPTSVDLSVLGMGTQEIYYSIEKPGCNTANSTITIDVAPAPALGTARNDTLCATTGTVTVEDYISGNDALASFKVFDSTGICQPASPGADWVFDNVDPGVYTIVYTLQTDPAYQCDIPEGRIEITIIESLNAGDDSQIPICKGQAIDMTTLTSSDAMPGGIFTEDGFPVFDPEQWLPASLNDMVEVQYILESNSSSCAADTAFITITLSDNLSAGVDIDDVYACTGNTILLSDFIENETPGGQFYLTSDLTIPVDENYTVTADTEFTYIIGGAAGCDPDSTDFVVEVVPDSDVTMVLSDNEICYSEDDCITVTLSSNVDGLLELIISGQNPQELSLIETPTVSGAATITLCPSVTFNDPIMSADTFYMGGDPLVQLDLNSINNTAFECQGKDLNQSETILIKEDFLLSIDTTICPGTSIMIEGQEYFASADIIETRNNGCDSIVNILISNYNLDENNIEQDLCEGQAYDNIPGFSFTTNIDTTVVLAGLSTSGCDSTINLNLTFTDKAVGPLDLELCFGDSIRVDGILFMEGMTSAEVPAPMPSAFGCDSATMVTVTIYDEVIPGIFTTTICEDETLPYGDMIFDATNTTGVSTLAGAAEGGCDSTVNVTVDFYPAIYPYIADLCANDTITIGTDQYHADNLTGQSSTQQTTTNGCDSIVNVQLNLINLDERVFRQELCEDQDFTINGEVYNFSNPSGVEYIPNATGCDSIYTISIIELSPSDTTLEVGLCSAIDTLINGQVYNESTTMGESTLTNAEGCDSIVSVIVEIAAPSVDFITESCPGDTEGTITITDVSGMSLPLNIGLEDIGQLTVYDLPYTIGGVEVDRDYKLLLDDGNCSLDEPVRIEADAAPQLDIIATELAPNMFQLSVQTAISIQDYAWTPAGILSCDDCSDPIATITEEALITLAVTSTNDCDYSTSLTLNSESIIVPPLDSTIRVYIPTVISSDENFNQMFYPLSEEANFTIDEMRIYDRWGNEVFANENFMTNTEAEGWDGRRGGAIEVEQGVYVYLIKYQDPILGEQLRQGTITVIR